MKTALKTTALVGTLSAVASVPALADPPAITDVRIEGGRAYVTLTHPDTGWDHFADVWRVFTPDGDLLAERILAHPHVNEQPFTRSTSLSIPDGLTHVHVVAECNHGDTSAVFVVELTDR